MPPLLRAEQLEDQTRRTVTDLALRIEPLGARDENVQFQNLPNRCQATEFVSKCSQCAQQRNACRRASFLNGDVPTHLASAGYDFPDARELATDPGSPSVDDDRGVSRARR